jgi:hypothetical protein
VVPTVELGDFSHADIFHLSLPLFHLAAVVVGLTVSEAQQLSVLNAPHQLQLLQSPPVQPLSNLSETLSETQLWRK